MSNSPSIADAMEAMLAAEDRVDALVRLTDRTARLLAEALADGLDSGLVGARLNQYREDRADLERNRAEAERLRREYSSKAPHPGKVQGFATNEVQESDLGSVVDEVEVKSAVVIDQFTEVISELLVQFGEDLGIILEKQLAGVPDKNRVVQTLTIFSEAGAAEIYRAASRELRKKRVLDTPDDGVIQIDCEHFVAKSVDDSSHVFSPSVGAPVGAGVGTSDPTGGDEGGALGDQPGAPSPQTKK